MVHLIKDIAPDYNLARTIRSGQIFHYNVEGDPHENEVFLVMYGDDRCAVSQSKQDGTIELSCSDDSLERWIRFFGMQKVLDPEFVSIMNSNDWLARAFERASGIRIIEQSPWQTLISFIISQNNNIPRISKSIRLLCEQFGEYNQSRRLYYFPTPEQLCSADLSNCGLGYRDIYITGAARQVMDGTLDLQKLLAGSCSKQDAVVRLTQLYGVGEKVANCVALFGLGHTDAFPVDTWIRKAMITSGVTFADVRTWGKHAGLVQQYMYQFIRNGGNMSVH